MSANLGVGALHFGSLLTEEESKEVILSAIDCGVNFFDTSPLYGAGSSEKILGRVLPTSEKVCIATKVGLIAVKRSDGRFGVEVQRLNEKQIYQSVEQSLKNLRREAIDLLMLHAYDASTPLEVTLAVLEKLYREGKVRSFGCSNYNPTQLKELLRKSHLPFTHMQCHYNMIERRAERFLFPICERAGIRPVVNRALARGLLSGRFRMDMPLPVGSRAESSKRIQNWITSKRLELITLLTTVAQDYGVSLNELALGWIAKKQKNPLILVGSRTKEQMRQNILALQKQFPQDLFSACEREVGNLSTVFESPSRYFEK